MKNLRAISLVALSLLSACGGSESPSPQQSTPVDDGFLLTSNPTWSNVGSAGLGLSVPSGRFTDPQIKALASNEIYVAFTKNTTLPNGPYCGAVMKWNGSAWSPVGTNGTTFNPGGLMYPSFKVVSAHEMYLSYLDQDNDNKATVMKFDGSSWSPVGTVGFSSGRANYTSLAVRSANEIYVAYQDGANSGKTTVQKWNGSIWSPVGSPGFTAGYANYQAIEVVNENEIYVACTDQELSSAAVVMKWDGSTWSMLGGDSATNHGVSALTFTKVGNEMYIAYADIQNDSKLTVEKWNGTQWGIVGAAGISAGYIEWNSMQVISANEIYVGYQDASTTPSAAATVMKWDGSSWTGLGAAGSASAGLATQSSPVFVFVPKSNGAVYVGYVDSTYPEQALVRIWR
jgi:hypothetical protein